MNLLRLVTMVITTLVTLAVGPLCTFRAAFVWPDPPALCVVEDPDPVNADCTATCDRG